MPSQWHNLQCRVSALFLTTPEDGVAPSILLTVQDNRGKPFAQYLYNIPDGASRLMLEHRARPGLQLNALFLSGTSPAEAGGLGSLVLRLKQDGHANLQLVGPHGEQGGSRQLSKCVCAVVVVSMASAAAESVLTRQTGCADSSSCCQAQGALHARNAGFIPAMQPHTVALAGALPACRVR